MQSSALMCKSVNMIFNICFIVASVFLTNGNQTIKTLSLEVILKYLVILLIGISVGGSLLSSLHLTTCDIIAMTSSSKEAAAVATRDRIFKVCLTLPCTHFSHDPAPDPSRVPSTSTCLVVMVDNFHPGIQTMMRTLCSGIKKDELDAVSVNQYATFTR